ncbi:hypothetical protein DIS07_09890 [Polaribacter aquimarinus]|uniref:Uncharacterized protein n=1 Tax=Polaribacter aquimarinus TaxID=2100726 RepID=A0A2U2J8V9_9FLAO|nr:hypothetical protein DIS07_09890 [Polaribacter aquimarinus]
MIVFLIPIGIDTLHHFLNHEHSVCNSKIEKHIHEKDIDCKLHLLKQSDSFLALNIIDSNVIEINSSVIFTNYNYLKNHYQLPFSLRGPPSKI